MTSCKVNTEEQDRSHVHHHDEKGTDKTAIQVAT